MEESKNHLTVGHAAASNPTPVNFKVEPKDVLSTHISDLIGNKFLKKRGATEREREGHTILENAGTEAFEGLKYVGLFFSAGSCPPCNHML